MVKSPNEKRKEHDRIFNTLAAQQKGIQAPMFSKEKQEKIEPVKVKAEKTQPEEPIQPPPQDKVESQVPDDLEQLFTPDPPVAEEVQSTVRTPEEELASAPEFDLEALFPEQQNLEIAAPEMVDDQNLSVEPDLGNFQLFDQEPISETPELPDFSEPEEFPVAEPIQDMQSIQEAEPEFDIVKERQFRQEKIREARLKMQGRVQQQPIAGLPVAPADVFDFDMLEDDNVDPNPALKAQENAMPLFEELEEQVTDLMEGTVSVLEKLSDSLEKVLIRVRQIEARIDKWGDI